MRFVKMDKEFIGKQAMMASGLEASRFVCVYLEIDKQGDVYGHGGEAILLDGVVVGSTASVAYGPHVDKILAFAYVDPIAANAGTSLQVMVHGSLRNAVILGEAAYDPSSALPRDVA